MQLMGDGIAVLGARLGMLWNPSQKKAYLTGWHTFPGQEIDLQVGVRVGERTVMLPLSEAAASFDFCDQRSSPTSINIIAIDPETTLRLEFTITAPFRPRDLEFSCTPVLDISCRLTRLVGPFRWTRTATPPIEGELFFRLGGVEVAASGNQQRVSFTGIAATARGESQEVPRTDALVWHEGEVKGDEVVMPFRFESTAGEYRLHGSWCTHQPAVMRIHGEPSEFWYAAIASPRSRTSSPGRKPIRTRSPTTPPALTPSSPITRAGARSTTCSR